MNAAVDNRGSFRTLVRACSAAAMGALNVHNAAAIAERRFGDPGVGLLLRGAVEPTDRVNAAALVQTMMPELMVALAGQSAAARIFSEGLQLSFGRAGLIKVPSVTADATLAKFVIEGDPIPVVQGTVDLATLQQKKIAAIIMMTAEMVRSSNIEALMTDALVRSCALALDAALFDANPEDEARPAGLRHGVAALTASTAPDARDAMIGDVMSLCAAVEPITSERPIMVMSPSRAISADMRTLQKLSEILLLLGSNALRGTPDVIAVARSGIASVFNELPSIRATREAMLVQDTVPVTDGTISQNAASVFQVEGVAIKVRLPVAWVKRSQLGAAWLTATNW